MNLNIKLNSLLVPAFSRPPDGHQGAAPGHANKQVAEASKFNLRFKFITIEHDEFDRSGRANKALSFHMHCVYQILRWSSRIGKLPQSSETLVS